ncbi:MAG: hypothetical protein V3T05_13245 [Myxococcota bacterium]
MAKRGANTSDDRADRKAKPWPEVILSAADGYEHDAVRCEQLGQASKRIAAEEAIVAAPQRCVDHQPDGVERALLRELSVLPDRIADHDAQAGISRETGNVTKGEVPDTRIRNQPNDMIVRRVSQRAAQRLDRFDADDQQSLRSGCESTE